MSRSLELSICCTTHNTSELTNNTSGVGLVVNDQYNKRDDASVRRAGPTRHRACGFVVDYNKSTTNRSKHRNPHEYPHTPYFQKLKPLAYILAADSICLFSFKVFSRLRETHISDDISCNRVRTGCSRIKIIQVGRP